MKNTTTFLVIGLLVSLYMLSGAAKAAISVSNFHLTENSVSFDLSGTLPDVTPASFRDALYFVNPNVSADPGFALNSFLRSSMSSFTGTQSLRSSLNPIQTGGSKFGDYFFVAFDNSLVAGEEVAGVVNATWNRRAFDLDAVDFLNVQWGTDPRDIVGQGVQLDTVLVPEPSSLVMIAIGLAALVGVKHRPHFA